MNALFPLAAMVVAFAFGYRFYAKLLALDVFRLEPNYSTPAEAGADGRDYVPTPSHLLFGHHVAAVSGGATFAAPIVALGWGWVPAFLWITVASAVAAGTYGLGSFWLSARHPGSLGQLARNLIGRSMRAALLLLALAALLILVAASAGLAATLLAAFPGAVLPLAAIALLAWAFGAYLHGRTQSVLLPASVIAFVASLALVWLLEGVPLALRGALVISLGQGVQISIDAVVVWVVLLLIYAFHGARLPVWKLMRPRGFLIALLLAVMLILFYVAIIVQHPPFHAPEFHAPSAESRTLPWLFLIIGSGAIAGWQLFIVHGVTGRELRRETDARYVGYGTALVQGVIALSALLIAATAFGGRDEWTAYYANVPSVADLPRALEFYVTEFGRHVGTLGLDAGLARHFAATVITGLALAVLEAAVRALKHLCAEVVPLPTAAANRRFDSERRRLWLIVSSAALLALHDGRGLGGIALWPLLALVSLWLAAAGFALLTSALRVTARPATLIGALAAIMALLAAWSTGVQLWNWWQLAAWLEFAAGVVIALLATAAIYEVIASARRPLIERGRPNSATELDT